MSYVRKRALLACDFCRHRKRRCTGEQPCSTCVESSAECHYKELPIERIESPTASNDAIVERLGRIESLLEDQAQQLQLLTDNRPSTTVPSDAALGASRASRASRARTRSPGEGGSRSPSLYGTTQLPYASTPAGFSVTSSASSVPIVLVSPELTQLAPPSSASLLVPATGLPPRPRPPPPLRLPQPHLAGFVPAPPTTDTIPSPSIASATVTTSYPNASYLAQQQHQQQPAQEHDESFLIPLDHSTAANTLLSLPLVRCFLLQRHAALPRPDGEDCSAPRPSFTYARTYFFDIECAHPLPSLLDLGHDLIEPVKAPFSAPASSELRLWWPPPALSVKLTAAYFARVHPNAPLFSSTAFREWEVAENQVWQDGSGGDKTTNGTPTIRTAVCLAVWALGALVGGGEVDGEVDNETETTDNSRQASCDQLAMTLFRPAFKILLHHALWEFDVASLSVGQGLLLAASFFSHMGRPLHNARLVYLANRHLLRFLEEQKRQGREPHQNDDIVRVLWIGFVLECDRAAELHVPRSGIEPLADHMPLPGSLDPHDANEGDNMICFVAEIAMRRLLNRIHSSLYALSPSSSTTTTTSNISPGSKRKHRHDSESRSAPTVPPLPTHTSITRMLSISAELNRQLEDWYQTIPLALRPPLLDAEAVWTARVSPAFSPSRASSNNGDNGRDGRMRLLRIYYYAALHLIYRPFVLHVAWQRATAEPASYPPYEGDDHDTDGDERNDAIESVEGNNDNAGPHSASSLILDHCAVCAEACTNYLVHVLPLLAHRSPYLWSLCQGSLACLLVLLVAETCPDIVVRRRQRQRGRGKTKDPSLASLNLGWLCDEVAGQLRRWAAPGSSFAAELAIIEQLPVHRAGPAQKVR